MKRINSEKDKERAKLWIQNNPDKRKIAQKKYIDSNKDKVRQRSINWKIKSPFKSMLSTYRQNAKSRGLEFNITFLNLEELWVKQDGLCYYTNKPMIKHYGNRESVSIDRVNSSKGYTSDNIVLCRKQVNIMKNDASVEELLEFCKDILNNSSKIMNL